MDGILNAFVEMLHEHRHLRYCRPILEAITDALEERGGAIRVTAESAHPLCQHSTHAIQRFFQNLPAVTHEPARTRTAPGIHLRTNTYHWDGRVTTILQQLREHLQN